MATAAAEPVKGVTGPNWFWEFLSEELAPDPNRIKLVGRMVLSATLVMILCVAYRVPFAFQAAIFTLLISRESTRSTLQSVATIVAGTLLGAGFVLGWGWFFTIDPFQHFLWIAFALFVVFFALSAINNYVGVLMFAIVIVVAIPLWDRNVPAEVNLDDTLWLVWVAFLGAGVTTAVELLFAHLMPGDNVIIPVVARLSAVEKVLRSHAEGKSLSQAVVREINRYAMLGTSLARRNSQRSHFNLIYAAQIGGVISLVGTLVDTAASLTQLAVRPSDAERRRAGEVADRLADLQKEFLHRKAPRPIELSHTGEAAPGLPLLRELEETVQLIPQAFASLPSQNAQTQPGPVSAPLFAPDAFTNPAHLQFAVKGTLAAMLCYVLYRAADWPGISTSVVTCVLTALTTIGSSRQKQVLRITGAAVGGFVFGMGAQIFVLPYVDTIVGFSILFAMVTAISAWFMTASPRLSYFGVQVALAFYLIHLQEFKFETSLSIARDRVFGVLLGLMAMWLVFDQLWGNSAAIEMRRTFIANLRLLAQLSLEPDLGDPADAIKRAYALGHKINANFDQVKNLGDGVLFEFGPSRRSDLASRTRINQWQSRLRALFLVKGTLLRYRLEVPGFELPAEIEKAQRSFDLELSKTLEVMAERLEGKRGPADSELGQSLVDLEQLAEEYPASSSTHLEDFIALSVRAEELAASLLAEV